MDLETLRLFVEVAEQGSLTKASITSSSLTSSLSRRISALERECGGRLLHRTGRGVTLTELGQNFMPRIKELLAGFDGLAQEMHASAGVPTGQVRIGVLASLAQPVIPRLYREVRQKHPGVKLYVFGSSNGKLEQLLADGDIDLALLFRYGRAEGSTEEPLGVVDTYLVGPPGDLVTSGETVRFADLKGLPLILPGPPNAVRVVFDQIARREGIELDVVMEANSLPIQMDIVAESRIYTVLAGHAVAPAVRSGQVQAARIVDPVIERTVTLGFSPRPATLAGREVARLIRQIFQETGSALGLRSIGPRNAL